MTRPDLWEALERYGLCDAHLDMLLRLLEVQRNGSLTWHVVHGSLAQCELRLNFPSRGPEVARVCEVVLTDARVLP